MFLFDIKMSIPSSKILKASKAIMAIADLKNNSPNSTHSQHVNVFVTTPVRDESDKIEKSSDIITEQQQEAKVITRDIQAAMTKTEELSSSIDEKENIIKALSLIIDIIQNNPLIVNKFVVAELETLAELIKLLTNSDNVEIDTDDLDCSCTKAKYRIIKRIYIKKDGEVYGISQCPVILRLFDNYKISTSLTI